MAIVQVNPYILKDVVFSVAADDYGAHLSEVQFTPSVSTITWQGLKPEATFTDVSTPTWECTITFAQDWSATGLSTYLYNHVGETVAVSFEPTTDGGPTFTADVVIVPGNIGGSINAFASSSVTLGVKGRPVLVPAV